MTQGQIAEVLKTKPDMSAYRKLAPKRRRIVTVNLVSQALATFALGHSLTDTYRRQISFSL